MCKQKNVFTGFTEKFKTQKQCLPVKTSKQNFVTFFMYFGNRLLDYF